MTNSAPVPAQRLLILFAKTPVAGQVKTRIGAEVGLEQAAKIYETMLETILAASSGDSRWQRLVALTPESDAAWFAGRNLPFIRQQGQTIGERMGNALNEGFRQGAAQVVVIGSDIPELGSAEIAAAFSRLDTEPAVVGPSIDGGFYLFGATRQVGQQAVRVLLAEIPWSTPQVLTSVHSLCRQQSLPLFQLPPKRDIDTYDDWLDYQAASAATDIAVSIIVPTLNEELYLADCLRSLEHPCCERIVVDGGSSDNTLQIARQAGVRTLRCPVANRGRQLNAGAAVARGKILLFFHADSRMPTGGIASMLSAMQDPRLIGGGFDLGFFPPEPFYRFLAFGANLFCRMTRMIFGDRGMFLRTDRFCQLGGFPETAIMEDAALSTSMRRAGKIAILPEVVETSARKYANETKLQAMYRTMWAYAAYRLGVSPETIKAGYYRMGK